MGAELNKGKEFVERLAEKLTLRLFRIGCEPKNYFILQKLPLTASEIEKELSLTPMPANKRINELMEVGLVSREKAGEKIGLTPLGKDFLEHIEEIKKLVIDHMAELI